MYGFGSVDDPSRERLQSTPSNRLPNERKVVYKHLDSKVCNALLAQKVNTREDIIELLERDGYEVRIHREDIGVKIIGSSEKYLRLKGKKYLPGFNYEEYLKNLPERAEAFSNTRDRQEDIIKKLEKNLSFRRSQNAKTFKNINQDAALANHETTNRNTEPLSRSSTGLNRTTENENQRSGTRDFRDEKSSVSSGSARGSEYRNSESDERTRSESDQSGTDNGTNRPVGKKLGFDHLSSVFLRIAVIKRKLLERERLKNAKVLGNTIRILRIQRVRMRKLFASFHNRVRRDRDDVNLRGPRVK